MTASRPAEAPLLDVRGLSVAFPSPRGDLVAVDRVSLSVGRGETVALVGESGSGKSMTALSIMRLTPPGARLSADWLGLDGTDMSKLGEREIRDIRGRRIAMVFQNPMSSLNAVLTIGRQITESLERHMGMRGRTARARAIELLALVDVPAPGRLVDAYPHQLSGGMRQRAMIAMALAAGPELLIADEPTTALDVTIQAQIMELLGRLQREMGMAVLLITHDLGVVAGVANRVYVMYGGRTFEHGQVDDVFRDPAQPYTMGLLDTVRQLSDVSTESLMPIPGHPPGLGPILVGCAFAPRCRFVVDVCREEIPLLRAMGPGRAAACHVAQPRSGPT
ncbi:MAG: ABC transporter ATP-binding protein [Chloroflexi bacterium]|nr:ABC transporter ATP-binding protein [Chloroflexota bacterium]